MNERNCIFKLLVFQQNGKAERKNGQTLEVPWASKIQRDIVKFQMVACSLTDFQPVFWVESYLLKLSFTNQFFFGPT